MTKAKGYKSVKVPYWVWDAAGHFQQKLMQGGMSQVDGEVLEKIGDPRALGRGLATGIALLWALNNVGKK